MRYFRGMFLGVLGIVCLTTSLAWAQAKVDQQTLDPDGNAIGGSVSANQQHVSLLTGKGSRFTVVIDGVEGPTIDALFSNLESSPVGGATWIGQIPVLFSLDSAHSAYSAKIGDDYVVVLDGKELVRAPIINNANLNIPLTFGPLAKHFFYQDVDSAGKYRIVVDGKPGPPSSYPAQLLISNDGEHYAYTGFVGGLGNGVPNWSVVDGKQVNYFGEMQYTAKNILVSTLNDNGAVVLLLNGKPAVKAYSINPMWISPDGAQIAMVVTGKSGDPSMLIVNDKEVPDAHGLSVEKVFFSANGKRYAALCHTKTGSTFMIVDGKKGQEYQTVQNGIDRTTSVTQWRSLYGTEPTATDVANLQPAVPGFTPDSSSFVYVAQQGGKNYLVVDDQESNGFQNSGGVQVLLSSTGHRVGFIGAAANGNQHLIIDGKDQAFGQARIYGLSFTPDGTRYAYINGPSLMVDGVAQGGTGAGLQYVFSPDDKHIAYLANDGGYPRIFLDGKIIEASPGNITRMQFSPDSQHVFWVKTSNMSALGTKDSMGLYFDDKLVAHFSDNGLFHGAVSFVFSSDGAMRFVARTDGVLKRFTITPAPTENVTSLLAAAKAPSGK